MVIKASPTLTGSPSCRCRCTSRPATGGVILTIFSGSASIFAGAEIRVWTCSWVACASLSCASTGDCDGTTTRLPSRCSAVRLSAAAAGVCLSPLQAASARHNSRQAGPTGLQEFRACFISSKQWHRYGQGRSRPRIDPVSPSQLLEYRSSFAAGQRSGRA